MYNIYFNTRVIVITDSFNRGNIRKSSDSNAVVFRHHPGEDIEEAAMLFESNERMKKMVILSEAPEKTLEAFSDCFKIINAGGGIVTDGQGRFLMILRNGIWDLPKGKHEDGEKISETALREVEEECGIKDLVLGDRICITRHTYRLDGYPVLKNTHWYRMTCKSTCNLTPQTEEGIEKVIWASREEITELLENSYPSIREVFGMLDGLLRK